MPTGKLVKPSGMTGGEIFFRGTHVLPLEALAEKYGSDRQAFMERGPRYGGTAAAYGDAAVTFHPFPRIPVTMILWLADEEFPARAGLLFDSTCGLQLPTDILWSLARLSCLALL